MGYKNLVKNINKINIDEKLKKRFVKACAKLDSSKQLMLINQMQESIFEKYVLNGNLKIELGNESSYDDENMKITIDKEFEDKLQEESLVSLFVEFIISKIHDKELSAIERKIIADEITRVIYNKKANGFVSSGDLLGYARIFYDGIDSIPVSVYLKGENLKGKYSKENWDELINLLSCIDSECNNENYADAYLNIIKAQRLILESNKEYISKIDDFNDYLVITRRIQKMPCSDASYLNSYLDELDNLMVDRIINNEKYRSIGLARIKEMRRTLELVVMYGDDIKSLNQYHKYNDELANQIKRFKSLNEVNGSKR